MVPGDSYEPSEALPVRTISKFAHPGALQAGVAKTAFFKGQVGEEVGWSVYDPATRGIVDHNAHNRPATVA